MGRQGLNGMSNSPFKLTQSFPVSPFSAAEPSPFAALFLIGQVVRLRRVPISERQAHLDECPEPVLLFPSWPPIEFKDE